MTPTLHFTVTTLVLKFCANVFLFYLMDVNM